MQEPGVYQEVRTSEKPVVCRRFLIFTLVCGVALAIVILIDLIR